MDLHDVQTIAISLASVIGAAVAIVGLTTWRKQLHGRQEYDVAVRLLTLVYRYREALQAVRNPYSFVDVTKGAEGKRELYAARWAAVNTVRAELDSELLTAEVLWGPDNLRASFGDMYDLDGDLYGAVLEELDNQLDAELNRRAEPDREAVVARRQLLYRRGVGDDYTLSLDAAVEIATSPWRKRLKKFR